MVEGFPVLSQTFVLNQVVGLQARGMDVAVVSDRVFDNPCAVPASMIRNRWRKPALFEAALANVPSQLRSSVLLLADLTSDVRLNDYDVLIAHFGANGRRLARLTALGRLRRPFITVFHGHDVSLPAHAGRLSRYRELFQRGDLLLPVSDYFRRLLLAAGAHPERTHVLRMGVDCTAVAFAPPPRGLGEVRFLTVGRLVEKKGATHAIAALAALQKRRPSLEWRLEVVGEGPLMESLVRQAAASGVADRVAFLGGLPHGEVTRRLKVANAFLLPSVTAANGDMEGVPVALMEAMAAGVPVVSTRHSGIPELIDHEVSGLLAREGDPDDLSRLLEWVIDNSEACEAMARCARAKVETEFSQEKLDDLLAELVRGLVSA